MGKKELTAARVYSGLGKKTRQDIFKGMPDDKSSFAAIELSESGQIAKLLTKGATRFRIIQED